MHLTHIFVPKNRRVDFELHIRVHDLTSIPLVTGFYSIKWRLKHASVTYGATNRAPIKNHAVQWDVNFDSIVHLVIGKDGLLQPCELRVDVIQVSKIVWAKERDCGISSGRRPKRGDLIDHQATTFVDSALR
ncbi:hypothetical protein BC938DRAFT_476164, partial [Jimgerdemannia flammicorona]